MSCVSAALRLAAGAFALTFVLFAGATASSAQTSTSCLPSSVRSTLNQIRAKFGPVRIVSTFRRGAVIAGTGRRSLHASCRAVDFHAPAGKRAAVIAWLRANHKGGLGIYSCGMSHLHIDNGGHYTWNKCVNRSGRVARAG
ncbi:MAG TPA: D-Ala-D-Ala carboxypeptidase family metallohydrolase [Hyphomicrobiaceae bacterium]|nr:D-Ala-D-Ala carboxypeptidase family metallohydrolase [Hyphomicrobiaceae bacterium]